MKSESYPTLEALDSFEEYQFMNESIDILIRSARLNTDYNRAHALKCVGPVVARIIAEAKKESPEEVYIAERMLAAALVRLAEQQAQPSFSE